MLSPNIVALYRIVKKMSDGRHVPHTTKRTNRTKNPFMPPDAFAENQDWLKIFVCEADLSMELAKEIIDQLRFYPPIKYAFVASMCGRVCEIACFVHWEEKGVLKANPPFGSVRSEHFREKGKIRFCS